MAEVTKQNGVNGQAKMSNGVNGHSHQNGISTQNGKKLWKVEFAPLNVPFERRMQTLAALCWISLFAFIHPGGPILFIYIVFCTQYWYLALLYLAWIFLDKDTCNRGGRVFQYARELKLWHYYRDYFPIKMVKTAELDPSKNYFMACHPHGVLSGGSFCCFGTEALGVGKLFPGITMNFLTLRLNFLLPIFRELCTILGLCSVTKESINYILQYPGGGRAAVIVPGGASESLDAHSGSYVVKLKSRKGFVKLALQNGVSLVPVFAFGENDMYAQLKNPEGSLLRKIQNKVQKTISVAPLLINGRGIFQYSMGILPRRTPIVTVVGAPLEAKHILKPTQEEIDEHHAMYVQALTKLFHDHREKYDPKATDLKIV